ncbi:MAG: DUF1566 domain-containing protein [Chloroflexota bacterium]
MYKKKFFILFVIGGLLLTACARQSGQLPIMQNQTGEGSAALIAASQTAPAAAIQTTQVSTSTDVSKSNLNYPIVDTGQSNCYDNNSQVSCAQSFTGQDSQYKGNTPKYQDNGDGTVTDLVTGLMWQKDPGAKMTFDQAAAGADGFNLAGYNDWRLPAIKELYSLIMFDGTDVSGCQGECAVTPFIDTRYFKFTYGDESTGERIIDSQFATSTKYVSTTKNENETMTAMFGVNFADGRIKGYGLQMHGKSKKFYVLYVRGNENYGRNIFVDNGSNTIIDNATGLTWMKSDSQYGMNWQDALAYCENYSASGANDWRLPNIKELQSIVDYSRSPDTTNSAAVDPIFKISSITNEAGQDDYPFFWSSTTHSDQSGGGKFAGYVSFGRALGYMKSWVDVHGAGAQPSDPKSGNASQYPQGHGPQGDAVRVNNYVRCVRGNASFNANGFTNEVRPSMLITAYGNIDGQGKSQGGQGTGQPGVVGQGGTGGGKGQPPQEAITACASQLPGAACSFTGMMGIVSGTCGTPPNLSQMACIPQGGPALPP